MKEIVVYGLRGYERNKSYSVADFVCISGRDFSIEKLNMEIAHMIWEHPDIKHVFMVNNSWELRKAFKELMTEKRDEKEGVNFKVFLEQIGTEIKF